MIEIRPISFTDTHPLRKRVLRNNDPNAVLYYDGATETDTRHFGAVDADGNIVGIASMLRRPLATQPDKRGWQLRGMATDEAWRRKGVGRALMEACFDYVQQQDGEIFWCNGRTTAIAFYRSLGLETEGEEFITETGPHFIMWRSML